jgi:hypothetical protein
MYSNHPDLQRLVVRDRHDELRRVAGRGPLRRPGRRRKDPDARASRATPS